MENDVTALGAGRQPKHDKTALNASEHLAELDVKGKRKWGMKESKGKNGPQSKHGGADSGQPVPKRVRM